MSESEYIHKSHNVSVLLCYFVCPARYLRIVVSKEVDKTLKDTCPESPRAHWLRRARKLGSPWLATGLANIKNKILIMDPRFTAAGCEELQFLPGLPKQWNTGGFKGLCVRGGAEVAVRWEKGLIMEASVKASTDNIFKIKLANSNVKFRKNGKEFTLPIDAFNIVSASLKNGETLNMQF